MIEIEQLKAQLHNYQRELDVIRVMYGTQDPATLDIQTECLRNDIKVLESQIKRMEITGVPLNQIFQCKECYGVQCFLIVRYHDYHEPCLLYTSDAADE